MTANAAATYRSNLGRPPEKCQNGQSQPLILLAVGEKSVAFPRYTGRVQMHPRLRPAMCIVPCITVHQISQGEPHVFLQYVGLLFCAFEVGFWPFMALCQMWLFVKCGSLGSLSNVGVRHCCEENPCPEGIEVSEAEGEAFESLDGVVAALSKSVGQANAFRM